MDGRLACAAPAACAAPRGQDGPPSALRSTAMSGRTLGLRLGAEPYVVPVGFEHDEFSQAPGLCSRRLNDVRPATPVDLAQDVYVVSDVDTKFTCWLTTNLIAVRKAEVNVDGLPVRAIAGLDAPVHRGFTVQEVKIEAEHINKVPRRGCHVSNGQDRLNTVKLMACCKFRGHTWRL